MPKADAVRLVGAAGMSVCEVPAGLALCCVMYRRRELKCRYLSDRSSDDVGAYTDSTLYAAA